MDQPIISTINPAIEWERASQLAEMANTELEELDALREQTIHDWETRREELVAMLDSAQSTLVRLSSWGPQEPQEAPRPSGMTRISQENDSRATR